MKKSLGRIKAETLLLAILTSMLLLNVLVMSVNAQETVVAVDPPSVTIEEVGLSVTVNITITDVTDLFAWNVYLIVDDNIVNITGGSLPETTNEDYVFYGQTSVRPLPAYDDFNGNGYYEIVQLADSLIVGEPFDGNGLLCQLTLTGIAVGTSDIEFKRPLGGPGADTLLLDDTLEDIVFTVTDGSVTVIPEFPAFAIMPLLIIATVFAVLIAKRKWLNKQYTSRRL